MAAKSGNALYACLNKAPLQTPAHLAGKSLYVAGGLARTLAAACAIAEKEKEQ